MERMGSIKLHTIWNIYTWHQKAIFVCIYKPNISFLIKVFLALALKVDCFLHVLPNQVQNQPTFRVVKTANHNQINQEILEQKLALEDT